MPKFDYDDFDEDDLVDYDDDYYSDEEMTQQEEEDLTNAMAEVKSMVGSRKIKDDDIKESLYHYDFDSNRAAKYLSDKYDKANKPKPTPEKPVASSSSSSSKSKSLSPQEQEPKEGSEKEPPKQSKLAALAQTRAQKRAGSSKDSGLASVNLLNKLSSSSSSSSSSSASASASTSTTSKPISSLSKLAKAREAHQNSISRASVATKLTVAPDDSKVSKPRIKRDALPTVDYNMTIGYPEFLRATPSHFGSLFCSAKKQTSSQQPRVTNTVFLPSDTSKTKEAFSKPSPDDVVQNAQEHAGFLEKGVKNMKIDGKAEKTEKPQTQTPKNVRKLDVNAERAKETDKRPSINFVVIGHVDAGKSTLMGRLLLDAGVVDQNTINKYKRESEREGKGSFHLAWVLDQTVEERRRGVTMDICMSQFETDGARFTIVDAPGHRDFVPNMIAGSSQADFAVLVVDASTNAFESGFNLDGQTKEHAILVRSLGVDNIIVAVNKLDTNGWAKDRYEEIRIQMQEFLVKVGFKDGQIKFVPTSGLNGDNVSKKSNEAQLNAWYQGPTLLKTLEESKSNQKDYNSNLRLLLTDVASTEHSSDISVSGRIDTGSVQVGEQVQISPTAVFGQVKGVVANSVTKDYAVAGDNVTLKLVNVNPDDLKVGHVVCNVEAPVASVTKFETRIVTFDMRRPLVKGTKLVLHRGRTNDQCKISNILSTIDKTNGQVLKSKPRHLISGQTANVEITLETPLPMETFKSSKELGRVILRKDGATVAAGIVDALKT